MDEIGLYRSFARYNAWMNFRLYGLCAGLDDQERRRDRGAFFRSIHSTLNHLLYGDRAWLGRFTGRAYPLCPPGEDLYGHFSDLRAAHAALDDDVLAWAEALRPADLDGIVTWTSFVDGATRSRPKRLCIAHLFNHQTHHRAQVATMLTQMGHDIGLTDLPFMPGSESS